MADTKQCNDWECPCCGAIDWHQFPDDCHYGPAHRAAFCAMARGYDRDPVGTKEKVRDYCRRNIL